MGTPAGMEYSGREINDPAEATTEDEYIDKLAEAGLIVDDRTERVMDVDTITDEELLALLRANAKGLYPLEAATELLIRDRTWLRRSGFRDACIEMCGPTDEYPHLEVGAWIRWESIGDALAARGEGREAPEWLCGCSGGQRRLLAIAHCIQAGPMSEVSGLGRGTQALILAAIAHAGGSHEHSGKVLNEHSDGTFSMTAGRPEDAGTLCAWPATS